MRLKYKLITVSSLLMLAAITLCCTMLLRFMRDQRRADVLEQAQADYNAFTVQLKIGRNIPDDPLVQRSYLTYLYKSAQSNSEFTLRLGDDYLINNSGIAPEQFFDVPTESGETQYRFITVNGNHLLIFGSSIYLFNELYNVNLVRDMNTLHEALRSLAIRCALISGGILLLFLILIYLFAVFLTKPIDALTNGAKSITSGQYNTHINVKGKDEVGVLAKSFNAMAEAIQKSIDELTEQNLRKQAFINDLSHELKTPVTSLVLNSETLETRRMDETDRQRAVHRIYEQAKWIERLSQKLMQLVLLQDEIKLNLSPLRSLFVDAEETVRDSLDLTGITLTIQCDDIQIPMETDLMRSALVNLIENAIKASKQGDSIELTGTEHEIVVRDHGCGIPQSEIERITEPFYMVDRSRSKKLGGSGLGLALVQRIVEVHHFTLSIESEPGVGSSFFIRFSDAK